MSAIVFLDKVQPGDRSDAIVSSTRELTPGVNYTEQTGTNRIEVYFSCASVDDTQARAKLEQALDTCGDDARDHLRVVYP